MTTPVDPPRTPGIKGWLLRDLPYAAMLGLAVGGIVLTSFRGATYVYWMTLAPVYALISIISGWPKLDTGAERMKLVMTQALHWLAFLGAMWLMFLPEVRGVVNDNATALTLLILLALGTFVAGVHAGVWRICAVGVFLAAIGAGGGVDPGIRRAAAGRRCCCWPSSASPSGGCGGAKASACDQLVRLSIDHGCSRHSGPYPLAVRRTARASWPRAAGRACGRSSRAASSPRRAACGRAP